MDKLKKAFSMDRGNVKTTTTELPKKRFSIFKTMGKSNTSRNVADLPRLNISSPCVEFPPDMSSAVEDHLLSPKEKYHNRPHSTHLDHFPSNASFTSSVTTGTASTNTTNTNPQTQSIHSADLLPPAPRRRSTKISTNSSGLSRSEISVNQDQRSITVDDSADYLQLGMKYHEKGELEKATHYWRLSAESGSPLGLFFYGIALRHGWGCKKNSAKAVRYLQSAAESAVHDLQTGIAQSANVAKSELVLAIYELGVCFRHGWGVPKNVETAAYYFEVASNLGDPDAQNDLGFCYAHGLGVKKDLYCSAKYYRLAERQGQGMIGNSWIWKDKYNQVDEPGWKGKVKK
ncbi:unnamed protein product [Mucor hiemalis]